jgi:endonuclease/exonuclease/phosphatase family metal-dependent hydrolase
MYLNPPSHPALSLMSYNVQNGIATRHYHHYFTGGWKHVLPDRDRAGNLSRIAALVKAYDLVALQEVDAGSFRTNQVNLTEYLAHRARFPWWHCQTNRDLGKFAQHSNGLLARFCPSEIQEYRLPGMLPGRGATVFHFSMVGGDALCVVVLHLALTKRTRLRQVAFIADLLQNIKHVIVMGDWNCGSRSAEMDFLLAHTNLAEPTHDLPTFPSWKPSRAIDHILVSTSLYVDEVSVIDYPLSDHLPMTMRVLLPSALVAGRARQRQA